VGRKLLWASLVLAPVAIIVRYATSAGDVALFVLSAAALVPLAWLIGEATEHAGEHTGPGIGGFLNASFGNAPELIIALFAISDGLPEVVRGSLIGSVVSNLLLVLGLAVIAAPDRDRDIDRPSLVVQAGLVFVAALLFLVPSVPGWHGDPERHSLAVLTAPVAAVLLVIYAAATVWGLRRHRQQHRESGKEAEGAWRLPVAIAALAAATVVTALVSEILVHSLTTFAHDVGLSTFFVSIVIVAIVGNAAEHGGAIVLARRGSNLKIASEIALSSSAQVAVLVTPAVALLSWLISPPLPLSFRPVELAALGGAVIAAGVALRDGRATRREGAVLVALYAVAVIAFYFAGDR
jgi:Ca2+:H+ antiporter